MEAPDRDRIHIWCTSLDLGTDRSSELTQWLSPPERSRATSFRFGKDRRRFTCARGVLRELLGAYTGRNPREIELSLGPHGKPKLAAWGSGAHLRFNLTHTDETALVGVAWDREIGVDLESVRPGMQVEDIARSHFSRSEQREIFDLPAAERLAAFYRCWTRKEAVLKALGTGLRTALADFDVSVRPEEPARLVRSRIEGRTDQVWELWDVDPAPGLFGAVAASGRGGSILLRRWHGPGDETQNLPLSCRNGMKSAE